MATRAQKKAAEQDARAMLEDHGLPQPDDVLYGRGCVWLFWEEERVTLEIVLDERRSPSDMMFALDDTEGDDREDWNEDEMPAF